MNLKKFMGLSCLIALALAASAKALMIAPPPGAQRVATADAVVIGKVTSIEAKTVMAARFPGDKEKGEYTIAVVKIDEALVGANGLTTVRVGFIVPKPVPVPGPGPAIRPPLRRYPTANLNLDQEACLFLTKHADEPFFTLPAYYDVISKKDNPGFAKEMETIKKAAKLLSDPKAGFESKEAEDRFLTAALVLTRYQKIAPGTVGQPKTEPIGAEESKKILLALADADWTNNGPGFSMMNPQMMFNRLPNKTDWVQPTDFKVFPEEAKKWLKTHAETYRVQKFVSEKPSEK